MPLRLSGLLHCASVAEADRVAELLPEHIRLTRAEPGCLTFEAERCTDDPTRFEVREVFVDRAAFEAHQTRNRASRWWAETAGVRRDFRIEDEG